MFFRFFFILVLLFNSCFALKTLTVGATSVPHAEILNYVKPILKESGIDLKIVEFNDYVQPNFALMQNKLDANFFQHQAYLNDFNQSRHTNLISLTSVHIEPMAVYHSDNQLLNNFIQTKSLKLFPKDLKLGIPNDVTNEGRALKLLADNNLIQIDSKVTYPTKKDVIKNPYNLKIIEIDASMLPRLMMSNQLDLAVINANFAILSGLSPLKDNLFLENIKKNNYINIIVIRADEQHDSSLLLLKQAINSNKTKQFINNKYKGAIIPAF